MPAESRTGIRVRFSQLQTRRGGKSGHRLRPVEPKELANTLACHSSLFSSCAACFGVNFRIKDARGARKKLDLVPNAATC